MIQHIATRCADTVIRKRPGHEPNKEWIIYYLEKKISFAITFALIFAIGLVFNQLLSGIVFILFFSRLKGSTGGYHAKSHHGCIIKTLLLFMTVLFTYYLVPPSYLSLLSIVAVILSGLVVLAFAPINHPNEHLSKEEIHRRIFNSRFIYTVEAAVVVVLFVVEAPLYIIHTASSSMLLVSATILWAKCIYQEETSVGE